jgi:hypothetical protein
MTKAIASATVEAEVLIKEVGAQKAGRVGASGRRLILFDQGRTSKNHAGIAAFQQNERSFAIEITIPARVDSKGLAVIHFRLGCATDCHRDWRTDGERSQEGERGFKID